MGDIRIGTRTEEIYEMIKKEKRLSIAEIRDSTDITYNTIRSAVIRLTNLGLVERVDRGVYQYKSK